MGWRQWVEKQSYIRILMDPSKRDVISLKKISMAEFDTAFSYRVGHWSWKDDEIDAFSLSISPWKSLWQYMVMAEVFVAVRAHT